MALIDKDGVVHEKGWGGQYKPKQGWFGPEKEKDFFGNPKIERDFFGNAKVERDWLGRPVRSSNGSTLYKPSGSSSYRSSGSSSSSSNSADAAIIGFLLLVIVIALIIGIAIFLLLIVPIFITLWRGLSSENGRKDLGVFSLTALSLTALGGLSTLSWEVLTHSYYPMWQEILWPTLAIFGWIGFCWIVVTKGWFRPMWIAVSNVSRGYWRGIVTMWDWTWSWL